MPGGRPAIVEAEPVALADSELLARLFRALGDATRLRVLELLLEEGELHQMELVRRLGATQNRISEHMSCLVWCGFVQSRTEGRRTLYRVTNRRRVASLLAQAKRFLDANEAQIACCRVIDPTPEES
ncbi:MAG TPA: metalloregulator ArsR/SmtB family transcription factor [Acidimicrobiales bacterium]|jgi:ArsR family transcriptional regulator, cadmium/lead-responsive transcriptional repressor|nr:metalloregulator ArsR/SmtB family transcription factor [Acidimicrobiales bacterium]